MQRSWWKIFSISLIVSLSRHQCPSRIPHQPTIHLTSALRMCSVFHSPLHILPLPPLMLSGHLAPSTCGEAQGTSGGHHLSGHLGTLGIFLKNRKIQKCKKNKDIMQNYYLYHFNQLYRFYQLYHRYISPINFVRYHWHSRDNCSKISHQLTMCHNNDNRLLSLIIWKYEKVWVTH